LSPRKAFTEYVQQVSAQLRWKRARPGVERELSSHLQDQYDALRARGLTEVEAEAETLLRMGDAVDIGIQLDRVHRPRPHWGLLLLTASLVLAGLLIHLFVTYDGDYGYRLSSHLLGIALGTGALLGAYFLDYTLPVRYPLPACLLLAVPVLAGLPGNRVNGVSFYAVQATLLLPLCFAVLLCALRGKGWRGPVFAVLGLGTLCVLSLLPPSLGGCVTVLVSGAVLLAAALWADWFAVGRRRGLLLLAGLAAVTLSAAAGLFTVSPTLQQRLLTALFPALEPQGTGWMGLQVRALLQGARFLGPGSAGDTVILPELFHPDFLLTWLIHRFGWIMLVLFLVLFSAFFVLAFRACLRQTTAAGRLIALSVVLTLLCETVLYCTYNLGFLLVHGISLPLVSYGNTALVLNLALIGVMLSVFRTGSLAEPVSSSPRSPSHRIRLQDGELIISLK